MASPRFLIAKVINMRDATSVFNPSNLEAETGKSVWAWDQPGLHSEFSGSQELQNETLY